MQYARTAVVNRATLLAVEADWLKSIRVDLVVSIHLCACPLGILFLITLCTESISMRSLYCNEVLIERHIMLLLNSSEGFGFF